MEQVILPPSEDVITMDELYSRLFIAAVAKCTTSKEAWEALGISEATFYKWKRKYGNNGSNGRAAEANAQQC